MLKSVGAFRQVWRGIQQLNPQTVIEDVERKVDIGVVGTEDEMDAIVSWLTQGEGEGKAGGMIHRLEASTLASMDKPAKQYHLVICASGCSAHELGVPEFKLFVWDPADPDKTLKAILDEGRFRNVHLALAHWFKVFRKPLSERIIRTTSLENAGFVASTAIGTIIPNPLAPIAAIAATAGDIVVLTANQVRMLFRLAGVNDKPVSYTALLPQIGSIVAAGFGWRSLARGAMGAIPFGGGLVAKSAVAYAGTWVVGEGIVRFFNTGVKMTSQESRERFQQLLDEGRRVAQDLVNNAKLRLNALRGKGSDQLPVTSDQ